MQPVKYYANVDKDKIQILRENSRRSGVYLFRNLLDGKTYVGSSVNIRDRMHQYYSLKKLRYTLKRGKSRICASLLKYRYINFSLEILEYCSSSELILREQHYLDLIKPEYNILPVAGSRFGISHTALTKAKLRALWTPQRRAIQSEYKKRTEDLNHLKKLNSDPVQRAKLL